MCKLLDERYLIAYTYTASFSGIRWQIIRTSNTAAVHTAAAAQKIRISERNHANKAQQSEFT